MTRVTAIVITFNEAANIEAALASLSFADEIIVVDSESTDDTVAIARRFTDKVIVRPWPGIHRPEELRRRAGQPRLDLLARRGRARLGAARRRDPRVGAGEIGAGATVAGYRMPRVTFHLGRWMRSTDWYPDYQLRLYDRRRARWAGRLVHESVSADGPVGRLSGEILHYAYRDLSHHLLTMDRYTTLAARQMFEDGRRAGWWDLALHPPAAFLRNYLLRGGFRDGVPGLIVSAMNARYVGLKLAKLWELCSASTSTRPAPGAADSSRRS